MGVALFFCLIVKLRLLLIFSYCSVLKTLSEYNVRDDLCSNVGVEACDEFAALHVKLLTKHGRAELHVERLVTYDEVFGVACDDGTHYMLPSLDEAILVERGFETLLSEKLSYEITYGFRVGAFHESCSVTVPSDTVYSL